MKTVDAARLCATIRAARPLDQPVRHGAPAEAWTGRASGGRIRRRKSDEASGMLRGHDRVRVGGDAGLGRAVPRHLPGSLHPIYTKRVSVIDRVGRHAHQRPAQRAPADPAQQPRPGLRCAVQSRLWLGLAGAAGSFGPGQLRNRVTGRHASYLRIHQPRSADRHRQFRREQPELFAAPRAAFRTLRSRER